MTRLPWTLPPRRRVLLAALALLPAIAQAQAPPAPPTARIVVIGDSQAEGIAGALVRRLQGNRQYRVIDKTKISTGLAYLNTYNWPQVAQTIATAEHADIAVVMFGANDRPPLRVGNPADAARTITFSDTYGRRIRDVIHAFRAANARVFWLGHPIVRDQQFSTELEFLNRLYEENASQEGAAFVPLWDLLAENGAYAAFGKGADGQTKRLRADDGVHMTNAGYDLAVSRLLPLIEASRQPGQPAIPLP